MFSLLLGLESCSSAKIALRKRCIDLDEVLSKMPGGKYPLYWDSIRKRNKYLEEGIIKGQPTDNPKEIKEAKGIFIWAARIIIFCWVGIVIYMAFWGQLLVCHI
jgi:hypothetical protein